MFGESRTKGGARERNGRTQSSVFEYLLTAPTTAYLRVMSFVRSRVLSGLCPPGFRMDSDGLDVNLRRAKTTNSPKFLVRVLGYSSSCWSRDPLLEHAYLRISCSGESQTESETGEVYKGRMGMRELTITGLIPREKSTVR